MPVGEVALNRYPVIRPLIVPLIILAAFTGCSDELHVSPPNTPENLSATFQIDIFGGEYVYLQWQDTNWGEDICFNVYRDGGLLAVVNAECLAMDELTCTDFQMHTEYYDSPVTRGATYCYAVSAHYFGPADYAMFGDSDLSPETCITIPLEESDRSR